MSNKIFSWIHLSDIHFKPKGETFNDVQIRKTLPKYLTKFQSQCDAIIITGDYRYAPKKEETTATDVCNYIKSISDVLQVENEKIILVPGNHDLDRSKNRYYLLCGVKNEYDTNNGTIDEGVLDELNEDFSFYCSIQDNFKNGLKMKGQNPHGIINLDSCYLLLLNTALIAGTDKDDFNQLIIGSKYLSSLLDNETITKPVIAIGHHGFDMFNHDEKKTITRYLDEKGVRLYLCGHTHDNWITAFGEKGKQINVGCMCQGTDNVKAGFSIGSLYDNGDVKIEMYMWDRDTKAWNKDEANCKDYHKLYGGYTDRIKKETSKKQEVERIDFPLIIKGYRLIGGLGCDGIKYVWEKEHGICVESLAFNTRLRLNPTEQDKKISSYTISSSMGCQLSSFGKQCVFCQTGTNKYIPLTADEIALQCIFMAEYDSDCPSYLNVRRNQREFAFMGQGEPGMCYSQIKGAIMLTDIAMEEINQNVSRYIISTCGITDFIPVLINDYNNKVFKNRVSVHFSLNAIDDERDSLMPINTMYKYNDFINQCELLYKTTNEKIGVGILLMVNYKTKNGTYISLDTSKLKNILDKLDPAMFKIDLCTVNKTNLGAQRQLSHEEANKYLEIAKNMGFECKLFASFGEGEESGCGMLTSSLGDLNDPGKNTMYHYYKAVDLLQNAKRILNKGL